MTGAIINVLACGGPVLGAPVLHRRERIVRALGPTWQHFMTDDASQFIAFPIDRAVHLRFVNAGAAAPALAVEIVDEHSHPVAMPPDPAIWFSPFDLASVTVAHQIMVGLITPYRNSLKAEATSAA